MLGLLDDVSSELGGRGVPHALIGAGALAVHGVSRSTFDLDLLATDRAVLAPAFWTPLATRGDAVDVRVGDDDDPLAQDHGPRGARALTAPRLQFRVPRPWVSSSTSEASSSSTRLSRLATSGSASTR